jgi:hypothetical protein
MCVSATKSISNPSSINRMRASSSDARVGRKFFTLLGVITDPAARMDCPEADFTRTFAGIEIVRADCRVIRREVCLSVLFRFI